MNACNWKAVMCASGSILLGGVAVKLLKIGRVFNRKNKDIPINEVLLYGDDDEAKTRQIGLNNIYCIYYVIVHASCSIDACVPDLESETIAKCLIGARNKKVRVRVIVHSNGDFDVTKLSVYGIEVKVVKLRQPLEHEFVLVDAMGTGEAVAVLGALDYETARVNHNRDATLLTSEPSVVKSLRREFDRVWNYTESKNVCKEILS